MTGRVVQFGEVAGVSLVNGVLQRWNALTLSLPEDDAPKFTVTMCNSFHWCGCPILLCSTKEQFTEIGTFRF